MARAAFIMDRLMSRVGLNGRSLIPMLSSYACAIPGIMATRTIEDEKLFQEWNYIHSPRTRPANPPTRDYEDMKESNKMNIVIESLKK